ncbi:MAG: ATP-binding protein [Opitutaceae bacterium]
MTQSSAEPQCTWPRQLSLALAGGLALTSLMTIAGWWLKFDELLHPFGPRTPLHLAHALGFAALSAALFALEYGKGKLLVVATGLAAAMGLLTLLQIVLHVSLPLDGLNAANASRGPVICAAAFLLGAGTLLWSSSDRAPVWRPLALAALGSLITSAGLFTLLGHVTDLPPVYTWGAERAVAPMCGIALALLGVAFLTRGWRESTRAGDALPIWSPLPVVSIGCTVALVFWAGLNLRERNYTAQTTQAQMDSFAAQARDLVERQAGEFERLARTWGDGPGDDIATWEADATRLMNQGLSSLGCLSISIVDPVARTKWTFPASSLPRVADLDHGATDERRTALAQAGRRGARPAVAMNVPTGEPVAGGKGFVIYAPIIRGGQLAGFVAAVFSYQGFFDHIATSLVQSQEAYHIAAVLDGEPAFRRVALGARLDPAFTVERTYLLAERRLRLTYTPSETALARLRRPLPTYTLAAGLGIAGLLGLSMHFARRARIEQRAAEFSTRKLSGENEERRRIEARLKVADERLRLALDSTRIGIFERNVISGHVYYSPGLWAMLGFDHTLMPATMDTWLALIHPDDLASFHRRVETQLQGKASIIEPEYRVRKKDGDWCWVYSRSKPTATGLDGLPTQIVGTVQDITARREAEAALRESQSEARKLSLVASRTGSPVLIGTAAGLIEWANEAFCRVTEYSLEEVVGRSPADLMVGPETDPRTINRIRAAMARGQGISTDVVNYSKSGRKYHLHLEIQPVRGAGGQIENFIAVQTDITARVEVEQQLRRAKAEADDTSRAKSDFLASMSHEIRTPMNGVIGMTSLLMETSLNPEQRDYVNTIRTSGEALLTIINDILDFSKIESGKLELEQMPFDLAVCLEEALDLFALQASAKKVELGYYLAPDVPPWICGDVTRLRQVIVNLVNNAVKFTPSGSISLEVRRSAAEPVPLSFPSSRAPMPVKIKLEFTVRDTGIGIPPDRVDRLFKAFSQLDSSTTRKYGGTGLGLAICQRLCQLMGGEVRVESAVGQGSAFVFTIDSIAAEAESDTEAVRTEGPLLGGLVLCVGASKITAARLHAVFERWGAGCVVVPDAAIALATAAKLPRPPSLVVVDGGETRALVALDILTALKSPRLLLFPFGQAAPAAPADGQPFAWTTIPLRTGALVQAIHSLFAPKSSDTTPIKTAAERPVAEDFPLEILLAEDNAVNQKVALRFLERLGYRADAVANGLEAVNTLEHRCYDLVLMDLQMPEMDGFEATRQIRARVPQDRQPKIVALTANAMQGDREACLAAGMDGYISKPVKMHEITEVIRRLFGKPEEPDPSRQLIG